MSMLYELKRTLKSKTVIGITIAVIAISLFTVYNTFGNPGTPSNYDDTFAYGYASNGTAHLVVNVYTQGGDPVQDSQVQFALNNGNTYSAYTSLNGYANFTLNNVNKSDLGAFSDSNVGNIGYNYSEGNGISGFGNMQIYLNQTSQYFFSSNYRYVGLNKTVTNYTSKSGRYLLNSYNIPNHKNLRGLQVFYEGNISQTSPDIELYAIPVNGTAEQGGGYSVSIPGPLNRSSMNYIGSYNGFTSFRFNPQNLTGSNISYFEFEIFTPSGKSLGLVSFQIKSTVSGNQVTQSFFNTEISIMGLFIPLMAVTAAYVTYGRDRTSGIIESVLVRPVTRRSLILSRYVAGTTALFLALLVTLLISTLSFRYFQGTYLPLDTFMVGLWSLFVAVAAFYGLVFFGSNFIRSSGSLLGFSIFLFIVFDFLWAFSGIPVIPALVTGSLLHLYPGSLNYIRAFVDLYYISPAGLPDIASLLVAGNSYFALYVQSQYFAKVGLTYINLAIAGVLWITVPLGMSVMSFVRRG